MLRIFLPICFLISIKASVANVVITAQGKIRGIEHDGFMSYVGIPYADVNGPAGRFKVSLCVSLFLSAFKKGGEFSVCCVCRHSQLVPYKFRSPVIFKTGDTAFSFKEK